MYTYKLCLRVLCPVPQQYHVPVNHEPYYARMVTLLSCVIVMTWTIHTLQLVHLWLDTSQSLETMSPHSGDIRGANCSKQSSLANNYYHRDDNCLQVKSV